jgi:hypothetical protein
LFVCGLEDIVRKELSEKPPLRSSQREFSLLAAAFWGFTEQGMVPRLPDGLVSDPYSVSSFF